MPVRVRGELDDVEVTSVSCGYAHTVALINGGIGGAYIWGSNAHGQLGEGVAGKCVAAPIAMVQPSSTRRLRGVSSGCCGEHSVVCYSSLLSREAVVAVVMGTHPRLGSSSPLQMLDTCIVEVIARM